jgi:hypothetical protein
MSLTGRFNLRKSVSGRLILQVEEEVQSLLSLFVRDRVRKRRWRDAKVLDLAAVELRPLIDLRYRSGRPRSVNSELICPSSASPSGAIPIPSSAGSSKSA